MPLPDHELHMQEVHKLASEARERTIDSVPSCGQENGWDREMQNARAEIDATTPKTASATPIFLGKAHEVIPHSYMLHFTVQHCKACLTDSMVSQFYALSFIRSRVTGKAVTHLIPCDTPLFNLPVEEKLVGRREVPMCHGCYGVSQDLSHLPTPPSASMLYDLEEPRLKGQRPKEAAKEAKKPASKKATLDDLA